MEQDAEAVMIPAATFRGWVDKFALWRGFVFDLLSARLASVLLIVDEVTFRRMDARLAAFLLSRSQVENPIRITHQEIAAELGSSREVISRIMEDFASQGLIQTGRASLNVLETELLETRAGM